MRPEHKTQVLVVAGVVCVYFMYFCITILGPYVNYLWKLHKDREITLRNVKKKNESSSDMIEDSDINVSSSEAEKQKAPIRFTKPTYVLPSADMSAPSSTLTQRKPVSLAQSSSPRISSQSRPFSTFSHSPTLSPTPTPTSFLPSTYNSLQAAERDYMLATRGSQNRAGNAARSRIIADSVSVRAEQDAEYAASIAGEEILTKVSFCPIKV
ncbi:hypothetical protein EON65_47490 [archaeon]|nr:MAG: hypothetical protein EON65_47490 [archaeon]